MKSQLKFEECAEPPFMAVAQGIWQSTKEYGNRPKNKAMYFVNEYIYL